MKKHLSLLLSILMLVTMISGMTINAQAAGNSLSNATAISFGTNYNDSIRTSGEKDFYKVTLPSAGKLNIDLTAYIEMTDYYIYDINGTKVWEKTYASWNSNTKQFRLLEPVELTMGTYYFAVCYHSSTYYGDYNFNLTFTSANESFTETGFGSNNELSTASTVSFGKTYNGQIAQNDKIDMYKWVLPTSGRVNIDLTAFIEMTDYYLYDENGSKIWEKTYASWNSNTKQFRLIDFFDLTKGTYYFAACYHSSNYYGNYKFKLTFTDSAESFKETGYGTNNSIVDASTISLRNTYKGQIGLNDNTDIYKFVMSSNGKIKFNLTSDIYCTDYYVYDANGNRVWERTYQYYNENTKRADLAFELELAKGTYYFSISKHSGTGCYSFSADRIYTIQAPQKLKITPSKTSLKLTWSNSSTVSGYEIQKKVSGSYKTIKTTTGTSYTNSNLSTATEYTYRVRSYKTIGGLKYYSKWVTVTGLTKLSTPAIKTPATNTKHQIIAKWSTVSKASGYQVQYCKNSSCSSVIATKTVSGQSKTSYTGNNFTKGKKYYVRVRAYKVVNGHKYYSSWSSVKSIISK